MAPRPCPRRSPQLSSRISWTAGDEYQSSEICNPHLCTRHEFARPPNSLTIRLQFGIVVKNSNALVRTIFDQRRLPWHLTHQRENQRDFRYQIRLGLVPAPNKRCRFKSRMGKVGRIWTHTSQSLGPLTLTPTLHPKSLNPKP